MYGCRYLGYLRFILFPYIEGQCRLYSTMPRYIELYSILSKVFFINIKGSL